VLVLHRIHNYLSFFSFLFFFFSFFFIIISDLSAWAMVLWCYLFIYFLVFYLSDFFRLSSFLELWRTGLSGGRIEGLRLGGGGI